MRTVDEHLSVVLDALTPVESEVVPLRSATARVARADVASSIDLPPWPNSAMDGYAVWSADLASASDGSPVTLPVVGDIPAGDMTTHSMTAGHAMRIMTGAPVPSGCDAVVPLEKTADWDASAQTAGAAAPSSVTFVAPTSEGANVRGQGEDTRQGQRVIAAGQLLSPSACAAAAAIGVAELTVARPVRVGIISTGSELAPVGGPLGFGQIYDSNGPLLEALSAGCGVDVVSRQSVADDPQLLSATIRSAQRGIDVLILTGGASVGAFDATREVLDRAHGNSELHRVEFVSVAMQPGKPQGFGVLDNGTVVFALPGNPVSVWVSFHLFIEPALRILQGRTDAQPAWLPAQVAQGWRSPVGREQFMPVITTSASGERLTVAAASARGSGSHLAATLAQATGIARIPAEVTDVAAGDTVLMRGLVT